MASANDRLAFNVLCHWYCGNDGQLLSCAVSCRRRMTRKLGKEPGHLVFGLEMDDDLGT